MIFALLRIVLRWLKHFGYDVPQLPSLMRRRLILDRLLSPPETSTAPNDRAARGQAATRGRR